MRLVVPLLMVSFLPFFPCYSSLLTARTCCLHRPHFRIRRLSRKTSSSSFHPSCPFLLFCIITTGILSPPSKIHPTLIQSSQSSIPFPQTGISSAPPPARLTKRSFQSPSFPCETVAHDPLLHSPAFTPLSFTVTFFTPSPCQQCPWKPFSRSTCSRPPTTSSPRTLPCLCCHVFFPFRRDEIGSTVQYHFDRFSFPVRGIQCHTPPVFSPPLWSFNSTNPYLFTGRRIKPGIKVSCPLIEPFPAHLLNRRKAHLDWVLF